MPEPPAPLDGVTVVDIGHLVAGPMVGGILGDFGARVIKVERPDRPDPLRSLFPKDGIGLWSKVQDRNKTPIRLDLKTPQGREILEQLLARADVLVENFRPGTLERLGLAPGRLLEEVNPGLVICRVSGWGQTGPLASRRGYGRTGEAASGFAHLNGDPDGPPMHTAVSIGDTVAAIWAAYGVLLALRARDRDGRGQVVDTALYEAVFRHIEQQIVVLDQLGTVLTRRGNANPAVPTVNVYPTRDGHWFSMSNATEATIESLIEVVGLADHPKLSTRRGIEDDPDAFDEHVRSWMRERDLEEIDTVFDRGGAVGAPIWSAAELVDHPHLHAREMVVRVPDPELGELRMPGIVPKLSRTPGAIRHSGRPAGDGTAEVLGDLLGMSAERVAELRALGVV